MGALDVLVIPIHFVAAIPTTPSPYVHVISKGPCTKLPLIIPFTSAERRRHWVTLRPVINIAMIRRVLRDMVILVAISQPDGSDGRKPIGKIMNFD
jgi:hypothetical protein